jgi:glycosyltransferase involved in cell wall biosynthesis
MSDIRMIFVSALDFSVGGAAPARQRAIMEGVARHGIKATLLNIQKDQMVEWHLPVRYLPVGWRRLPWRLQALVGLPIMLFGAFRRSPDIVMCYDRDPIILGITMLIARFHRVPVVHELTEYPDQVVGHNWYGWITVRLFERFFVRGLSGALVISRALETYVKTLNRRLQIIRFPAIASFSNDDIEPKTLPSRPSCFHIVYTGSLSEPKDGVVTLLRAFAAIDPHAISACLSIYGHGTEAQRTDIQTSIKSLDLCDTVVLHTPVPHAKVRAIMATADLLVLARPMSRQAQGGFPTKLAEYLAAGRPVLTTITGDIGRYLCHNIDSYLVPPDDTEAFAGAMRYAWSNRSQLEAVGQAARATARAHFCPENAAAIVAQWIKKISSRTFQA